MNTGGVSSVALSIWRPKAKVSTKRKGVANADSPRIRAVLPQNCRGTPRFRQMRPAHTVKGAKVQG